MSFYIADKFQCKDTWELIDSDDCTCPIAELVKWSNRWTIQIFRSLTSEAETIVLDFVSQNRRGEADELSVVNDAPGCICLGDGLMGMKCLAPTHAMYRSIESFATSRPEPRPEPEPEPSLPVWLL